MQHSDDSDDATGRQPGADPADTADTADTPDAPDTPGTEPEESAGDEGGEHIREPAKLVRLSRMIQTSLVEIRDAGLDEQARTRVRGIVDQIPGELVETVSPDLREELDRLRSGRMSDQPPSEAELRIEQAQLVGWLQGVLGGIQTALSAEQAGTQAELEQIRQQSGGGRGPQGEQRQPGQFPGDAGGRPPR